FLAELMGTYCIIFAGCGSVAVNRLYGGIVTFPGICITWGLIVTVMIYTLGHVSGAHFNPAVTYTLSLLGLCPLKEFHSKFYSFKPISGASMNPARTLGPAIVLWNFTAVWVYILGPTIGAIAGAFVYKLLKPTDKSFSDIVKR
ncbi:hypothetical protein M8C21_010602, partial [Ambrosia artemisiifolia]